MLLDLVETVSGVTGAAFDLLFRSFVGVDTAIGVGTWRFLRAASNPSA